MTDGHDIFGRPIRNKPAHMNTFLSLTDPKTVAQLEQESGYTNVKGHIQALRNEGKVRSVSLGGRKVGYIIDPDWYRSLGMGFPDAPETDNSQGAADMIEEFLDSENVSVHDTFQKWRTKHQNGVFLNLETQARARLHGTRCQHLGAGPPYFRLSDGLGSLTSKRKVCGEEPKLLHWAATNGVSVEDCQHCLRDGLIRTGSTAAANSTHIILGHEREELRLREAALNGKASPRWICTQQVRKGDRILVYFYHPTCAIVASAIAARDPRTGGSGRTETTLKDIHWLDHPIALEELRKRFPDWAWTENCASRPKLKESVARQLWTLAMHRDSKATTRRRGGAVSDAQQELDDQHEFDPTDDADAREKVTRQVAARRGQKKFREALLRTYGGRCVLTGCDAVEALEAAHLKRYFGDKSQHRQNGLLLRADIHTLFDLDLIAINPESMKVELASSLKGTTYETELWGAKLDSDIVNQKALEQRWAEFQESRWK